MRDFFEIRGSYSEQLLEECHYLFHALEIEDIELAVDIAASVLSNELAAQVNRIAQIYINDEEEA